MLRKRSNRLLHKSISITIAFGAIVMLLSFSSCGGKKKTVGDAITERDSLPMMKTLGVTTLISDSGVTRYRVKTEEWLMFDRKKPSYWALKKEFIWNSSTQSLILKPASKQILPTFMINNNFGS